MALSNQLLMQFQSVYVWHLYIGYQTRCFIGRDKIDKVLGAGKYPRLIPQ